MIIILDNNDILYALNAIDPVDKKKSEQNTQAKIVINTVNKKPIELVDSHNS